MRVIAGSIKGRRLKGPRVGDLSIRPTSDKAREAIFSILQYYETGPFLDLFAGTGAVAIEAWSRGYRPVTCVEVQPSALACIKDNVMGTEVKIVTKNIQSLSNTYFKDQAVIFADPPYSLTTPFWTTLSPIIHNWLISGSGILIWETDKNTNLKTIEHLTSIGTKYYGSSAFHMFIAQ